MEEKGHLLRLRYRGSMDFDKIALDDGRFPIIYEVERYWNRLTYEGAAIACATDGSISLGSPMDQDPYWEEANLFGTAVFYATVSKLDKAAVNGPERKCSGPFFCLVR